ncbi:MAG: Na+/H+ antiporter subunit E [Candidatus Thermoplasmatota archaeon]|nr:Na+/H+ antiporter subunit E [Candidatus Thermoplasmatota archaeon]
MSRMPYYLKQRIEEVKQRSIEPHESSIELPRWEKMMITWISMLVFWVIVSGRLSWQNILIGGLVSTLISNLLYENLTDDLRCEGHLVRKILYLLFIRIPEYVFIMLFQLVESNIQVAKHVLLLDINPSIVKIETDLRSDTGITLLSNSITLTPGTLTIDVDKKLDKTNVYVHWIDATTLNMEEAGNEIKGDVERWLKKIFW